jgi:signal transduction histidine kinase
MSSLALSIHAHLLWPSVALGVALLWLCVSLYERIGRLRYAYRETEKENEKLHTRLAEAERQLQYLRQLTENVDTALFVCSTDGRIDWMNHAASVIASGTFLPDNILQAITEHAEMVEGCALSTVLLRIDGQRRLVVALKDVSALMQRQEMEAWQQLIRVLTHEIMNSLTPIISISETLTDENEAFAVINRRCHSLLNFVESYRQLTRIKAPERTTFPVSDLFAHIKVLFPIVVTLLDGKTVEPQLTADRSQLEQVLINLIKNAYESGATKVEVSASDSVIRVKDNGCGMSPDVLEHAFIPFFTTKPSGTGIGLSLCRQIILKHGGSITIDSQEGRGTTFTIKL